MENAVDALKLGFFILIFIIALSVFFMTISQAISASDDIVFAIDKTNYYPQYKEKQEGSLYKTIDENGKEIIATDNQGNRVVKSDTVISSIYRYLDETYTVIIRDKDNNIIARFDKDVDTYAPWKGSRELEQQRIKMFLSDQTGYINGVFVKYGEALYDGLYNKSRGYTEFHIAKIPFSNIKDEEFIEKIYEANMTGDYEIAEDIILEKYGQDTPKKKIFMIYTIID